MSISGDAIIRKRSGNEDQSHERNIRVTINQMDLMQTRKKEKKEPGARRDKKHRCIENEEEVQTRERESENSVGTTINVCTDMCRAFFQDGGEERFFVSIQ
jgi:hypothetical protein